MLCWAGTGVFTQQVAGTEIAQAQFDGVLPIRETAGADAMPIGLAVAEGEKWCCAAACVKVHGAPQCTAAVFEVRTAFRAFPTAHIRFPTLDCPSDVCVTDDTHSTPLAIPHPTHHIITPLHSIAGLSLPHARDVSLAAFDGGGVGLRSWQCWQWWQWWSAAADGKDKSRQWHSAWGCQGQCVTNRLRCVGGRGPRTKTTHRPNSFDSQHSRGRSCRAEALRASCRWWQACEVIIGHS